MTDKMMGGIPPADKTTGPGQRTIFLGIVECPMFSEQARLTLEKDGLLITAKFDQLPIPYGEIIAFSLADYRVEIQTRDGMVAISHMGQAAQWLYDKLYASYNNAVLSALLVESAYSFEAYGEYIAEENGMIRQGTAILRLYEDCVCILPPNEHARRVPLCFLTGMEKSGYTLTLTLSTGERYSLLKLGRELNNLQRMLTDGLQALRERTMVWIKELAPSLGSMQVAMAARMMPLGTAAPIKKLSSAAPPLAAALEQRIRDSHIAQTYPWLCDFCGGQDLAVGSLPPPRKPKTAQTGPGISSGMISAQTNLPTKQPSAPTKPEEPKPILWVIAPDREQRVAAVELALADNEAAATYLYRIDGEWEPFALLMDRVLEATGFQRKVLLLPNEKLNTPEHLADAMMVHRTPALAMLRSCFVGRAIHSSPDRWRRDINKCRTVVPTNTSTEPARSCRNCGVMIAPDAKFCGRCGSQQ